MVLLIAYRIAWALALPLLCAMAALEHGVRAALRRSLWPAHWRLSARLAASSEAPHGAEPERESSHAVWLHAASLGECKGLWALAQTLGATLDSSESRARILITTNTTTGLEFLVREIAREPDPARRARYTARLAPFDHPRVAKRFLAAHNVRVLVLFEVELWPHWIAAAQKAREGAGVPVLWISARLSERARRRYAGNALAAGALARVFRNITWIQAQTLDEEHALRRLGAAHLETGGDLRGLYALGLHNPASTPPSELPASAAAVPAAPAPRRGLAFVSIHAGELAALLPHIPKADTLTPEPVFVFPRKMHEVQTFMRVMEPHGFVLHSRQPQARRVIVDSFGRVNETLRSVRTAVVGGSFGPDERIGGHNLWEPLLAGCDLVIGPHHANQAYLVARLQARGLLRVATNTSVPAGHSITFASIEPDAPEIRSEFIREERERLTAAAHTVIERLLKCLSSL